MNANSNTYTFIYASILVIVAAATLAVTALVLKKSQEKNIEIEKKLNILASVGEDAGLSEAKRKKDFVEETYDTYIVEDFIVDGAGNRQEGDAFNINMAEEYHKIKAIVASKDEDKKESLRSQLRLPVFVYKEDNGALKYIIPVRGVGLWGPLWGYLSLNDDFNTIYGAVFGHKGETPGLGAEISDKAFAKQFTGKKIFSGETLTSIRVMKGGAPKNNPHAVDAVSGGTITSDGVAAMLKDCLEQYQAFFIKMKEEFKILN
ncbi:MAG: NADH:ubiquinone reductase (Na(+)-transporting) subunit C [Prevotellaceae bacterium]|jgi:Na+-transporting NADH:ubiquinone oxidoreductase subunit C|nr:NADH:ubiquinone reductase (Na(+)-transporting) subunit C [Prevotellaceae bacterium]